MSTVFLVAEAGACHDGDFVAATRLVDAAADAGADAVKFQFWSSADELAARRRVPEEYRQIYRRYQLSREWLPDLWRCARERGLAFLCTTYLPRDVAVVEPWVDHFKVASFEAEAADLYAAHAPWLADDRAQGRDRWLIVSTGMAARWHRAFRAIPDWPTHVVQLRLLHCVSSYPAPVDALNLRRLWGPEPRLDGFSDHSLPAEVCTGGLAVAAGANIVEAHLRLISTDPQNPDAAHAMDPLQFAEYARVVRLAERARGTGAAEMQPCEAAMAQYRVTGGGA